MLIFIEWTFINLECCFALTSWKLQGYLYLCWGLHLSAKFIVLSIIFVLEMEFLFDFQLIFFLDWCCFNDYDIIVTIKFRLKITVIVEAIFKVAFLGWQMIILSAITITFKKQVFLIFLFMLLPII